MVGLVASRRRPARMGTLLLGDGRRLGYAWYGQPDGEPVFYFHGHPGSRLEGEVAGQAGPWPRVIALTVRATGCPASSRDGPSPNSPLMSPRLPICCGIGRFSVAGAFGGGPYALACAWRLPGRVIRAAVISGMGPYQVPGITKGMRWQNRIGFRWGSRGLPWPGL